MSERSIGKMWPDDIAKLRAFVADLVNRQERDPSSVAKAMRKIAGEIECNVRRQAWRGTAS